jgi:hypothetical protein
MKKFRFGDGLSPLSANSSDAQMTFANFGVSPL